MYGSTLLDSLPLGAFSQSMWFVSMAIFVTPLCLVPTLKESLVSTAAETIGAGGMASSPEISFKQVATTFAKPVARARRWYVHPSSPAPARRPKHTCRVSCSS